MPVRNIECQIAQAQMGRYLNGDPFSEDAQRQLEGHLRECPDCGSMLRAKRTALMSLLAPTHAVVEIEEPSAPADPEPIPPTPKTPTEALLGLLSRPAPAPEKEAVRETVAAKLEAPAPKVVFTKPLILSGLLAVTLIVMSQIAKNPETIFGPRSASIGATAAPFATKPEAKPEVAQPELKIEEFVPGAFAAAVNEFDGSPEALQATIDGTAEMMARMHVPQAEAPGPEPVPVPTQTPVRQERPRVRRANRPTATENNRVRIAPPESAVRVYPPETNP